MPGSTVFSSMTDEQLALWHQQDTRIQQLTRALAEARTVADAAQAAAEVERADLKANIRRSCDEVIRLTQVNASERAGNRRLCAEQVQLVKALRALIDFCDRRIVRDGGSVDNPEFTRVVRAAAEVVVLCEVPFG